MKKINIKPLSVNVCWQGKRFKTPAYKKYERDVLLLLPKEHVKFERYSIIIHVGVSNIGQDLDNVFKPFFDVLQKKYGINDKDIFEIVATKEIVKKGSEFISFKLNEKKFDTY